ncbi:MAG TPA: anthranilate synthase component I family protein [Verrucomicrobiae bacterium]
MHPLIQEIVSQQTPETLTAGLAGEAGVVLLRSYAPDNPGARYSFVTADPFLTFRSFGSSCELSQPAGRGGPGGWQAQFGNPWHLLEVLMARYELLEEIDLPFPLGGAFGYWGYELKNFTEPKLPRRAVNDLELPDCHVGFYDSLVVFDHQLGRVMVVATGLAADGSRSERRAQERLQYWQQRLIAGPAEPGPADVGHAPGPLPAMTWRSSLSREAFMAAVVRAQQYIRSGDIYQVNLSHRLTVASPAAGWSWFTRLAAASPAPFAAYLDCDGGGGDKVGRYQLASSSPEQFLRMSGAHIVTRPIKGTRPRHADANRDAQLAYELQTSAKELAELVMITDLLRNDLGKVCEYGSVLTPEIAKLEKFAQVQHLVSTVEGRLRREVTHFAALASTFPGGSITGAPKFRSMEIIDELEPISRGPYCGCLGYLGFNRESQLNIAIRTAVCLDGQTHFNVGAGIVADSDPAAEYEETLAKARGFFAAAQWGELMTRDTAPSRADQPHRNIPQAD